MRSKLNRSRFIKKCLLAGCFFGGVRSADSAQTSMKDGYDNLESLKKEILWVTNWWNVTLSETMFVVCLQEHPSFGQSRKDVYAWRKNSDGSFELVWTYRTTGIGRVEVKIEKSKGIISVKAIDNTALKDSVIAFAHLGAAVG